ncbi:hypothetical protein ACQEVB_12685 [Pseudonocardia sp. CA-107938]|uniref:hypothetical protein n=1 Tax=Pseudonocardia sp. CA-107938 TaxID=3240021 RepID=UPI003D950466
MSTAARLTGFGAVLALVFGGSWALGTEAVPPPAPAHTHAHTPVDAAPAPETPATGYRMVLDRTAGPGELAFTVIGPDGRVVPGYTVAPNRPVQVVVVRSDGTGYQHLQPRFGSDAVWRAPLAPAAPGLYRATAELTPAGGPALRLDTELFVPGPAAPAAATPSRVWQAGDYQVRLDGDLVPGTASQVFATVTRGGAAVTDLQPLPGGFGQLVALRLPDLALLHARSGPEPAPTARSGPGVALVVDVPTAGTYRLFFDFRHADAVRTAEFTVPTRDSG